MNNFKKIYRYTIAFFLGSIFVLFFANAATTIKTNVANAIQVIQRTLFTIDGNQTGTMLMDINSGGKIFINPLYVATGTANNSGVLSINSSGVLIFANVTGTVGATGATGAVGATGASGSGSVQGITGSIQFKDGSVSSGTDKLLRVGGNLDLIAEGTGKTLDIVMKNISSGGGNRSISVMNPDRSSSSIYGPASGGFNIYDNTVDKPRLSITRTGYVGLGIPNPNNTIQVKDLINFDNTLSSTFLGYQVGSGNIGFGNTAIGYNSLLNNTTGIYNTAVGFQSLQNNISGSYNTAIGVSSLNQNTSGRENTAVGYLSLQNNRVGSYNTAIGFFSLLDNISGNQNTAIGRYAGFNSLGNSNIFIGYTAGYNETGSNKLYIANTDTKTLIYGDFSSNRVGINTTTPNNTIQVKDLINFDNTTHSTFLGYQAGSGNTLDDNTAIGYFSLKSNTQGAYNTAIGKSSLQSNLDGSSNTAIGNTSLQSNAAGNTNTAIGDSSLLNNIDGNNNTAIGSQAGYSNVLGGNNVFLGYSAGYYETGDNKLYIANTDAKTLIYGNFNSNRVGINTSSPQVSLEVNNTFRITPSTVAPGAACSMTGNIIYSTGGNQLCFCNGSIRSEVADPSTPCP